MWCKHSAEPKHPRKTPPALYIYSIELIIEISPGSLHKYRLHPLSLEITFTTLQVFSDYNNAPSVQNMDENDKSAKLFYEILILSFYNDSRFIAMVKYLCHILSFSTYISKGKGHTFQCKAIAKGKTQYHKIIWLIL